MLKILLVLGGVLLLLWVFFLVLRGIIALLEAPLVAIERRKADAQQRILTDEENKYQVEVEAYQAFCMDLHALEQHELAEFWAAHECVPVWYATSGSFADSGEAKLVREFDDQRLFLCRARGTYKVVQSDAMSTVRTQVGAGTPILCFQGKREWGYGWSIYRCTAEEIAMLKAEFEEAECAKGENEKLARRARLGLAPEGQSSE